MAIDIDQMRCITGRGDEAEALTPSQMAEAYREEFEDMAMELAKNWRAYWARVVELLDGH